MVATHRGVDNKESRRGVVVLHIRGRGAVRFTPVSGHVRRTSACLLRAKSGHAHLWPRRPLESTIHLLGPDRIM
jgi:hypothetical protein